jgi:hypothetical protein
MTYTLIAHTEVGSGGSAAIEFNSIPATFTDLVLQLSLRNTSSTDAEGITIRFNGDNTSGNYSGRRLFGNGSNRFSDTTSNGFPFGGGGNNTASTFGNSSIYIPNYRSGVAKSISADGVAENNATVAFAGIAAGLWSGTAVITSIRLTQELGTSWAQFSSATLYGITAGSSGGVVVS